ncbi:hypothetical protein HPP92_029003 [Vanilla planifolia]|uniref:Uncharacterized protein n=1 Tax=Vanilla planifolia TaxID=51239 RepID=A0A835P3Z6_VANPL|nr:hypothetical protein HPP92_029003 [Vanilla planifolia]KAG0446109.1 hypothetical protein HPP92_028991 [Vanilla planifolia]
MAKASARECQTKGGGGSRPVTVGWDRDLLAGKLSVRLASILPPAGHTSRSYFVSSIRDISDFGRVILGSHIWGLTVQGYIIIERASHGNSATGRLVHQLQSRLLRLSRFVMTISVNPALEMWIVNPLFIHATPGVQTFQRRFKPTIHNRDLLSFQPDIGYFMVSKTTVERNMGTADMSLPFAQTIILIKLLRQLATEEAGGNEGSVESNLKRKERERAWRLKSQKLSGERSVNERLEAERQGGLGEGRKVWCFE